MKLILHCTTLTAWRAALASGMYEAPSLKQQGFIHFSKPDQMIAVANTIFHGQQDLVLLCIDEERLSSPVRYENLEGGTALFPHVYGLINLSAVMKVIPFPPEPDGAFLLPKDISAS